MLPLSRYSYSIHPPHRSQYISLVHDASSLHPKRYLTADVKMITSSRGCNRIAMVAMMHEHPPMDILWDATSHERIPLGVAEIMAGASGLDLVVIESCFCDLYTKDVGYRISHFQPTMDPLMVPVLKRMLKI
jgi:hypothetical protein